MLDLEGIYKVISLLVDKCVARGGIGGFVHRKILQFATGFEKNISKSLIQNI